MPDTHTPHASLRETGSIKDTMDSAWPIDVAEASDYGDCADAVCGYSRRSARLYCVAEKAKD
jgi:hypothetical protein